MHQVPAVDYIREDAWEAARREAKVDPELWVCKYLAQRLGPGAEVLAQGCDPGAILIEVTATDLELSFRARFLDPRNTPFHDCKGQRAPGFLAPKNQKNSRGLETVAPRRHS